MPDDLTIQITISLFDENGMQYSNLDRLTEIKKRLSVAVEKEMSDLRFEKREKYDYYISVY